MALRRLLFLSIMLPCILASNPTISRARRATVSRMPIRLLPVGDSITAGRMSTDGYGYRLALDNLLKADGTEADFIGTQRDGTNNTDNENEGYGGYRISAIMERVVDDSIMDMQPSLVLIHAGTNDNDFETPNETYADAPARLGKMVDYVLCRQPNAILLLAKLIQNKFHDDQTDWFNDRVPGIVTARQNKGYNIAMVDMTPIKGDELSDQLHPTDAGYDHMAQIWYAAIKAVPATWWSTPLALQQRDNKCLDAPLPISPESRVVTSTSAAVSVRPPRFWSLFLLLGRSKPA